MAENRLPESKRLRRSLSRTKNKGKKNEAEAKGALSSPPASTSIASFFNNVLPPEVSCPLCGQKVPRYRINQHIDDVCQKNGDAYDMILVKSPSDVEAGVSASKRPSDSSPYFAKKPPMTKKDASTPEKNPQSLEEDGFQMGLGMREQTSPYFKKGRDPTPRDLEPRVHSVGNISLGSLSSKLSRRRARGGNVSGDSKTCPPQNTWGNSVEKNLEAAASEDGSQKENVFPPSGFRQTHSPKDYLLGRYGTLGPAEAGTSQADNEDSPLELISLRDHACGDFVPPIEDQEQQSTLMDTFPDFYQGHSVANGQVELSDLETRELCSGEQIPLPRTEETSYRKVQNVSSLGGDVEVLPVEGHKPSRNEMIAHVHLEEVGCENTFNIGFRPVSDSEGHPYYLRNFLMVLEVVLENEEDRRLFDQTDLDSIAKFYQLSASGQKLYVRLFQRKWNWMKTSKIEYAEIAADLSPVLEELLEAGLLQSETDLQDLSEVLGLLSAPELKSLAKAFHLTNPNAPKHQLLEDFFQLAKQRSIFGKNQDGIRTAILKRAKDLAGKSVRICKGPRSVFSRVLLLFSLTDPMEDEEAGSGGQGQLSTVLLVNMGRMVFPTYTVSRKATIFHDRDDFIRYASAAHESNDISMAMANGNWKEAHKLYSVAKGTWRELKNHPSLRHHTSLPEYLRHFTVGWVYTRILSRGVEILQRLHLYEEAAEQLQELLAQEIYCRDSRGRWWDRLALNLHQHLKDTEKAVGCIRQGLLDPCVRTGHLLALYQRAQRMKDSPACKKLKHLLQDLPVVVAEDVKHVSIRGRLCPQTGMGKSVFIMEDLDPEDQGDDLQPSTVMCSVEELALAYYRQHGFDEGIHGEGSTFMTLFGLLMWDILFMDGVPDVFRNPYQTCPLDLYTDSFYQNRREAIESRLQLLHDASPEALLELMADVWNAQEGTATALISWDRFSSLQQAQSLVRCFRGPFVSGVCRQLATDLRHCRGGLPDLVVWRREGHQFKLVEVKGPRDRLSYKQMVWLAKLQQLGAEVEVCHVAETGSKTQRLN